MEEQFMGLPVTREVKDKRGDYPIFNRTLTIDRVSIGS
jgi:hypothetical protein